MLNLINTSGTADCLEWNCSNCVVVLSEKEYATMLILSLSSTERVTAMDSKAAIEHVQLWSITLHYHFFFIPDMLMENEQLIMTR